MLRVRVSEGTQLQANLLWDSAWSPPDGMADWVLPALTSETQNRGGLRSVTALHTNIVLCLFTDKRMPDDHPLRYLLQGGDQRGWWGDGADVRTDLSETEMGSLLWIFERSILTEDIRRWVEAIAIDGLMPLINQGVAVRIDAQAFAEFAFDRLDLAIQIYGRDGTKIYDHRFDDIWKQSVTSPKPAPFPQFEPPPPETLPGLFGQLDFSKPSQSGLIPLI